MNIVLVLEYMEYMLEYIHKSLMRSIFLMGVI